MAGWVAARRLAGALPGNHPILRVADRGNASMNEQAGSTG